MLIIPLTNTSRSSQPTLRSNQHIETKTNLLLFAKAKVNAILLFKKKYKNVRKNYVVFVT